MPCRLMVPSLLITIYNNDFIASVQSCLGQWIEIGAIPDKLSLPRSGLPVPSLWLPPAIKLLLHSKRSVMLRQSPAALFNTLRRLGQYAPVRLGQYALRLVQCAKLSSIRTARPVQWIEIGAIPDKLVDAVQGCTVPSTFDYWDHLTFSSSLVMTNMTTVIERAVRFDCYRDRIESIY